MLMHVAIVCSFSSHPNIRLCEFTQFVYSVADRHLDNFQFGAIMSSAAMNILKISFDKHEHISARYIPG